MMDFNLWYIDCVWPRKWWTLVSTLNTATTLATFLYAVLCKKWWIWANQKVPWWIASWPLGSALPTSSHPIWSQLYSVMFLSIPIHSSISFHSISFSFSVTMASWWWRSSQKNELDLSGSAMLFQVQPYVVPCPASVNNAGNLLTGVYEIQYGTYLEIKGFCPVLVFQPLESGVTMHFQFFALA